MPTPAQIAANIANAQASTGPRTAEGKATSSQNGVKLGLFASRDFVRPEEQRAYADLNAELLRDLAPVGVLERNLVDEIRRTMWRLRRCGDVEANLILRLDDHPGYVFDPMEAVDPAAEKIQRSVDRARGQAFHILRHASAELRRLQTARTVREGVTQLAPNQAASAQLASNCNQLESIARGAPCPCGSGAKFKRCCGKQAAPLLHRVHRAAV